MCKREKREGKGVFLFFFSGVWIDREVSNYTSPFSYFRPLPCNQTHPKQKCQYVQMKMVGEAYWWWKDNHRFCEWFVLHDFLRTRYARHFLHASEVDCKEPNVEHEPELERPQFSNIVVECKVILAGVGRILESMAVKVTDPEPPALVVIEIVDDLESELGVEESEVEVIAELAILKEEISSRPTEVEEFPIETLVDLPKESTIELVSSLAAMKTSLSLGSLDVYDTLQKIFYMRQDHRRSGYSW